MALTETARLRLEGRAVGPIFEEHRDQWTKMAEDAKVLMAAQLGEGRQPTVDDIKKTLLPLVELNPTWRTYSQSKKMKEKYWISDFTDYILHRIYNPTLHPPPQEA